MMSSRARSSSRGQRGICSVIALHLLCATIGSGQAVSGIVRDSASGKPLAGAHIELRRDTVRRVAQTDDEGAFVIAEVTQGLYRLSVRRLGFAVRATDLDVGSTDLAREIMLIPIARDLDTLYVRAGVTGIYGVVGAAEGLRPLADAKVHVLGERRIHLTDSTGTFFVPLRKGGLYVVRITRPGYAHRMFPITVSGAVDASRLLDSATTSTPGLEVLWQDFHQRLQRAGINSALLSGSDVRRAGSVEQTTTFNARGLVLGGSICVYLNGTPRPGMNLDVVPIDRIEVVELYGETDAAARELRSKWPPRAPCGFVNRGRRYEAPSGPRANAIARWAVVWLKQ